VVGIHVRGGRCRHRGQSLVQCAVMEAAQRDPSRADDDRDTPGFYDVVHRRRDVRAEFSGGPVDGVVLGRVLAAAHSAPSVGLSQPWDFVLVTDDGIRRAFWEHVQQERRTFAASLEKERAERFAGIKVDGVLEASLSVVVTYDPARGAPGVLGRHAIADAGLYSVCLAIENMWLACTAEGWGMGWVSFYRESFLRQLVGVPESIRPVAWLCLGPVTALQDTPDLERHGWRARVPLTDALHLDHWDQRAPDVLAVAATSRAVAPVVAEVERAASGGSAP
jgi:5,6-dimethylbenzimidazole synthase